MSPSISDTTTGSSGTGMIQRTKINGSTKNENARKRTGSMSAWDSAAIPTAPPGTLRSALLFLIPVTAWVGSVVVVLISMFLLPLLGYYFNVKGLYIPLFLVIAYYGKRLIFGHVKRWPQLQLWLSQLRNKYPYFQRQALILDDGVEPEHFRMGQKAMLCSHPHGMFCLGWGANILWNKFSLDNQVAFLGTESIFWIPGFAEYATWLGSESVSKSNVEKLMKKGTTIGICTGGFEEATLLIRGRHRLFLKDRKGFIKFALRYGYKVYPVYTFGEEESYHVFSGFEKFRLWLNNFKLPGILVAGRWGTLLPLNHAQLITVIGAPIECPLLESPTAEDVDKYHSQYLTCVQSLFEKYKEQYAYHGEKAVLEFK